MGITREEIQEIVSSFDRRNITIGVLGSHSALEVAASAKAMGSRTVVIVEIGRHSLYSQDYVHLFDNIIQVKSFQDIVNPRIQNELLDLNTIFVPNRSFSVYVGYDHIENSFRIPVYGNRYLLRAEERSCGRGQYHLLEIGGIRFPKRFDSPNEIDRLTIVKVQRADNKRERVFLYVNSKDDYYRQVAKYTDAGLVDESVLSEAIMEEYVLGARLNANFHAYALHDLFEKLDLVGLSDRRQVNLQGYLNLPAHEQLKIEEPVTNEEISHFGITLRESKQSLLWSSAKKFLAAAELEYPPGVIGPFGLQGALAYDPEDKKTIEFVVFDVSVRVPGDPAIGPTSPNMRSLSLKHKMRIESPLDLVIMEIRRASTDDRLTELVT
ncbi:MAG: DUF1297 domain-containing protein [Candidatus Bathyarchaeia archaeon]